MSTITPQHQEQLVRIDDGMTTWHARRSDLIAHLLGADWRIDRAVEGHRPDRHGAMCREPDMVSRSDMVAPYALLCRSVAAMDIECKVPADADWPAFTRRPDGDWWELEPPLASAARVADDDLRQLVIIGGGGTAEPRWACRRCDLLEHLATWRPGLNDGWHGQLWWPPACDAGDSSAWDDMAAAVEVVPDVDLAADYLPRFRPIAHSDAWRLEAPMSLIGLTDMQRQPCVICLTGHRPDDDTGLLYGDERTGQLWVAWDTGTHTQIAWGDIGRAIRLVHRTSTEGRYAALEAAQAADQRYQ